jgi:probable phosphoglycerate mutase
MQLIFVRHGEPDFSASSVDPPLSEKGIRQAEETAIRLSLEPIDKLVTSPLMRARQTISPLAEAIEMSPEVLEGVAEIDQWGGSYLSVEELRKAGGPAWDEFLRDPIAALGGDEKTFRETVTTSVGELTRCGSKRVVIATHGFPINVMLSQILGLDGLTNFTPHHGSVTRLHADDSGRLRVITINEMTHISRDGS